MLAYVFWHWPQPGVDAETYVDHLVSFHRTLNENKPVAFNGSRVLRMHGVSWLNTTGDAYEDWYLVNDSSALDSINEGAVSGPCEAPHNLEIRTDHQRSARRIVATSDDAWSNHRIPHPQRQ